MGSETGWSVKDWSRGRGKGCTRSSSEVDRAVAGNATDEKSRRRSSPSGRWLVRKGPGCQVLLVPVCFWMTRGAYLQQKSLQSAQRRTAKHIPDTRSTSVLIRQQMAITQPSRQEYVSRKATMYMSETITYMSLVSPLELLWCFAAVVRWVPALAMAKA